MLASAQAISSDNHLAAQQVPGQPPRITPLSLLRNVTSSGAGQAAWPRDLLESIMAVIAQAERAMPASSQLLMSAHRWDFSMNA